MKFLALLVIIGGLLTQLLTFGAANRVEWPTSARSTVTNSLPIVVAGVPHGFLESTFHLEQFDARTTVLQGFIVLSNRTDVTNSVVLCLRDSNIAAQIEILDMNGNRCLDPEGRLFNWKAETFHFVPDEAKRFPFKVRLQDYFAVKPGLFQLLFIFNERAVKDVTGNGGVRIFL